MKMNFIEIINLFANFSIETARRCFVTICITNFVQSVSCKSPFTDKVYQVRLSALL